MALWNRSCFPCGEGLSRLPPLKSAQSPASALLPTASCCSCLIQQAASSKVAPFCRAQAHDHHQGITSTRKQAPASSVQLQERNELKARARDEAAAQEARKKKVTVTVDLLGRQVCLQQPHCMRICFADCPQRYSYVMHTLGWHNLFKHTTWLRMHTLPVLCVPLVHLLQVAYMSHNFVCKNSGTEQTPLCCQLHFSQPDTFRCNYRPNCMLTAYLLDLPDTIQVLCLVRSLHTD